LRPKRAVIEARIESREARRENARTRHREMGRTKMRIGNMIDVATPPTVRVTAGPSLRQSGMASLPDITPSITSNNNSNNSITPLPSLSYNNLSLQPRRENTHHTVVVMNITRTVVIVDINKNNKNNNSSSSVKMLVTTKEVEVIKLASQVCTL